MSSTRGHEPRSHLRQRSTSLPSFNEAQSALKYAQKHPARRLVAYFIVVAFLSAFLMLGFGSLRGAFDEMIVKGEQCLSVVFYVNPYLFWDLSFFLTITGKSWDSPPFCNVPRLRHEPIGHTITIHCLLSLLTRSVIYYWICTLALYPGGLPDFESIPGDGIRTITAEELRAGGWKRFIVVGDVHGMLESWEYVSFSSITDSPMRRLIIPIGRCSILCSTTQRQIS